MGCGLREITRLYSVHYANDRVVLALMPRLSAGGVVIVFNKQQIYLLEDLQDMMRKVRDTLDSYALHASAAGLSAPS